MGLPAVFGLIKKLKNFLLMPAVSAKVDRRPPFLPLSYKVASNLRL